MPISIPDGWLNQNYIPVNFGIKWLWSNSGDKVFNKPADVMKLNLKNMRSQKNKLILHLNGPEPIFGSLSP
jgi:hypothetical protein